MFFPYLACFTDHIHPGNLPDLSESKKGSLTALTPHRGCAPYPNQWLLAFISRAHTFLSYRAPAHLTFFLTPLFLSTHKPPPETRMSVVERGKESPGYYLTRSRSVRLLFTVTKQVRAFTSSSLLIFILTFILL